MKGYRTLIFNLMACVPMVLEFVVPVMALPEFQGVLPPEWLPWWALGVAVGNIWLRSITTTPMGKSE